MQLQKTGTYVLPVFLLVFSSTTLLADRIDAFNLLEQQNATLLQVQNSFWTQLLNKDPISSPRLEERTSHLLYEIDFLRSEATDLQPSRSLPAWPTLSPDVASRLSFYRERATQLMQNQLQQSTPMELNFATINPAPPGAEHRSHYPTEPITSASENQCTTGGFITNAQLPRLEGFQRNRSLLNNFDSWTDRECKTPGTVSLQLGGQTLSFTCNPGGSAETNLNNAFSAMEMCNPMLYGFVPRLLPTTGRVQSLCKFPDQTMIGRSSTYPSPFSGPDSNNPSGYRTYCDDMADGQLPRAFQPPPGIGETDAGLVLAARLALENPAAFAQMKARTNQLCSNINSRHPQHGHCQNLNHRISEVERVMNLILQPALSPGGDENSSTI